MRGPGFNFLACGCSNCRDELTRQFCRIVHREFSVADEKNLDLLAERLVPPTTDSIRERIAAYSGPLPDASA